ncbi:hypothetical protein ACN47E_004195 [Coniothyrium glycines]
MAEPIPTEEQSNYETFRDCMSEPILKALAAPIEAPKAKQKRHQKKSSRSGRIGMTENNASAETSSARQEASTTDAEDLSDFIEFLSADIFTSLPPSLRTLNYSKSKASPHLQETYSTPLSASTYTSLLNLLPPPAIETLESASLLPASSDALSQRNLLVPVYTAYIASVTAAPPVWATTRAAACELCARDWVPLTYHHLIPRSAHERVRKRGWHEDHVLHSVAWLCRACHSFVHRLAGNEALAKGFYTVELIVQGGVEGDGEKRAAVEAWVKWIGGVRWRSR